MARFCQHCGKGLQEEAKFCSECGKKCDNQATIEPTTLAPNVEEQKAKLSLEKEFHFAYVSKAFNLIAYHADIYSDGVVVKINKYNKFFRALKYNQKSEIINMDDIDNVIIEKRRPFLYIIWLLISILLLVTSIYTFQPMYIVLALVCIFFWSQKDKYLVIFHKNGILKIKDSIGLGSDAQSFVDFIHHWNPNSVKNYYIEG